MIARMERHLAENRPHAPRGSLMIRSAPIEIKREYFRIKGREYYARYREKKRAEAKERWIKGNLAALNWKSNLKTNYGITVDEYYRMLEKQLGLCAICLRFPEKKRKLAVDHDHLTKKVRGLLCDRCNRAIGLMGDSAAAVSRAVAYLRSHNAAL